jgi:hypothetical protein
MAQVKVLSSNSCEMIFISPFSLFLTGRVPTLPQQETGVITNIIIS